MECFVSVYSVSTHTTAWYRTKHCYKMLLCCSLRYEHIGITAVETSSYTKANSVVIVFKTDT